MTVGDLQEARGRVLLPAAGKGRAARPKPPAAVPVAAGVLSQLVEATDARSGRRTRRCFCGNATR